VLFIGSLKNNHGVAVILHFMGVECANHKQALLGRSFAPVRAEHVEGASLLLSYPHCANFPPAHLAVFPGRANALLAESKPTESCRDLMPVILGKSLTR
jgi:hypothetical protein